MTARQDAAPSGDLTYAMRRAANPYRVLAHALDVADRPLAEALALRLGGVGLSRSHSGAAAEATVERLLRILGATRARG